MEDIVQGAESLVWPLALVGASHNGKYNLMLSAWATQVAEQPLLLGVPISPQRYTHDLIKESGELVFSVLANGQSEIANYCGNHSGRDTDKLAFLKGQLGLKTTPATVVKAPLVAGAVANLECKVVQALALGDYTTFVVEVVAAHLREDGPEPLLMYHWEEMTLAKND